MSASVSISIATNTAIALSKGFGFAVTGSPTLFAETVHSLADVGNQLLLKVIRNEYIGPQTWGIYIAAAFGVAALLWFAAVRRYHQEKLAVAG